MNIPSITFRQFICFMIFLLFFVFYDFLLPTYNNTDYLTKHKNYALTVPYISFSDIRNEQTASELSSEVNNESKSESDSIQIVEHKGPQYFNISSKHYEKVPVTDDLIEEFSIIIVSFNEKLLLKTINGVIENTLPGYVHEIIVIDDCSTPAVQLPETLPSYIKVYRPDTNIGLIRARIMGGNLATSKYLAFIDAHVYVDSKWLVTPKKYMQENNRTIVNFINFILDETRFRSKPLGSGFGSSAGIGWDLHQWWGGGASNDDFTPITMGMFAITKYWWSQGEMDDGLNKWGGENVEISFRTWLCGGQIRVAKDSYVAHLFRKTFPYTVNGRDVIANYIRVAKVWIDSPEYLNTFYKESSIHLGSNNEPDYNYGNITNRLLLKQQLGCKPFDSYVQKFKHRSPCSKIDHIGGKCGSEHTLTMTQLMKQQAGSFLKQFF